MSHSPHSPLPWMTYLREGVYRTILAKDGLMVAVDMYDPGRDPEIETVEANAELIVRAVNLHDELVAALEEAINIIEETTSLEDIPHRLRQTLNQAKPTK